MKYRLFGLPDLYILLLIHPRYKYIARDANGSLWVYEREPKKNELWFSLQQTDGHMENLKALDEHALLSISWKDSKAMKIPDKKIILNVLYRSLPYTRAGYYLLNDEGEFEE